MFGDCDPAGIMYFPRFYDLFHQAMENWFGELGFPYAALIQERKIGFPAVRSGATFERPCAFGSLVYIEQRVAAMSTRSLTFDYRVLGADDQGKEREHARGETVTALLDLDPASPGYRRARPIPDDLRAAIEVWLGASR